MLGGGERIRTDDLLRARQALSHLSYTPPKKLRIWDCGSRNCYRFQILNPKSNIRNRVVGLDGIEPSTSRLSGVRSNHAELQAPDDFGSRIANA